MAKRIFKTKKDHEHKKVKRFAWKNFLFGLASLTAGVLIFVIAPGNEPLTLLGFLLVLGGIMFPTVVLLRQTLRKIFFWIPAAIIAFVIFLPVSLVGYLVFFFPNEIARQILEVEIAKALNRPTSIGQLKISLLKGISVESLSIKDRDGETPFLDASLVLSYDLLPILTGRLVINKAVLESPSILITRKQIKGRAVMSIDDLLEGGEDSEPEEIEDEEGGDGGLPLAISVGEVGLRDGSVVLEDTATAGFPSRYTLDKLDCLASDLTWPMVKDARIDFGFRIIMEEIGAPTNTAQSFRVNPGLKGQIILRKMGEEVVPEGRLDFFALDGLFYGQRFLSMGEDFLGDLKKSFFGGIKKEAEKNLAAVEDGIRNLTSGFTQEANQKIENLVSASQAKLASLTNDLESFGRETLGEFDSTIKHTVDSIDREVTKLEKDINDTFNAIGKIYPAAKTKLKLTTYTSEVKAKVEKTSQDYQDYSQKTRDGLAKDINQVIENEKKRFDDWSAGLSESLDSQIEKYSKTIRDKFSKQLADAQAFADGFELEIPFLSKRFEFDRAEAVLMITNGRMAFENLTIRGKGFDLKSDGSFGLVDSTIEANLTLYLAREMASNPLLKAFVGEDGRPEIGIRISTVKGDFEFSLLGPSLVDRMGGLAKDQALDYINDYLEKNVQLDGFLSNLGSEDQPDSSTGKSAIKAKKSSRSQSLESEKTRKVKSLADEAKAIKKRIEEDAKKAIGQALTGGLKLPF